MSSDPIIEEIKSKLDIVDVVSNYLTLKRSGANYKAPCPFHGEKTPSFMVNRERQIFRCFGCGEAGDVFTFVMKQENIDFPNALQLLASQSGVTLPERSSYKSSETSSGESKNDLFEINKLAAKFFYQVLTDHDAGKAALKYLKQRGLTDQTIKDFELGFAPSNHKPIEALFRKYKISSAKLRLAGSPERFNNRVMFPFRDVIGRVVGFSGRALGEQMPKYLNTADTTLFHKNRYLYGLFAAKKAIATEKKVILVEGQLDLILAHQVGTNYAVATSGTALTDDHLTILRRYSDTLHLAFDGDDAGKKATERAIELALKHAFDVWVVPIPNSTDPAEIIVEDPARWRECLSKIVPAIEWLFNYYFPVAGKVTQSDRERVYRAMFPYIDRIDDAVSRAYALQHLTLILGLKDAAGIQLAFTNWQSKTSDKKFLAIEKSAIEQPDLPATDNFIPELPSREREIIGLLLLKPDLLDNKSLHLTENNFSNKGLSELYKQIISWYTKSTNKSSSELIVAIEATLSSPLRQSLQKLIFDAQTNTSDFSNEQYIQEYTFLVRSFRQKEREERIENFASQIAKAEANNDRAYVIELIKQIQDELK